MGIQHPRLEKNLKKTVTDALKALPKCWFFKVNTLVLRGIPDIMGVVNGHFFAWELKREKLGRATTLQKVTLHLIRRAGGIGHVVDDSNFESCFRQLEEISRLNQTR